MSLLEAELVLETLPSIMAASSIALARYTLCGEAWNSRLMETTGYELNELEITISYLNELFLKASSFQQQAVQDKYKQEKFLCVSSIKPKDLTDIKFS